MPIDTIAMMIVLPIAGLMFLALAIGAVLIVRDTLRRKGNWGINFKPLSCPCCGDPAPYPRIPKNWREALWGGINCLNCGLEYDKWGCAVDESDLQRRREEFEDDAYARPRLRLAKPDDRTAPPGRMT